MTIKKTHEEFAQRIYELTGNEFTVVGNYINSEKPVRMKHNGCGHEWNRSPEAFYRNPTCPKCNLLKRSITHEEFVEKVFDVVGNEYEVVSRYTLNDVKVDLKHIVCGNIYSVAPYAFFRGSRCSHCSNIKKRKTHNQFIDEVYELLGNEYTVLSEYKTNVIKLKMRHNKCGHEWMITPHSILHGGRCPVCSTNATKTHSSFISEVFGLVGNEYTVLESYTTSKTKIAMKHNVCGHTWMVEPSSFLYNGTRCPKCYGVVKKTIAELKLEIDTLTQGKYCVIGEEYRGNKNKILVRHNECGHVWEVLPNNFLRGTRCPKCNPNKRTHQEFVNMVYEQCGQEYSVLSKYDSIRVKVTMKHNECGYEWRVLPNQFLEGSRCPKCSCPSKGETKIADYLKQSSYKIKVQVSFNDCRHILPLKFDFGLYLGDDLCMLIEYQGQQHYKSIKYWGGDEGLKHRQMLDNIKRDYCRKNGIRLLEISYKDNHIDMLRKALV